MNSEQQDGGDNANEEPAEGQKGDGERSRYKIRFRPSQKTINRGVTNGNVKKAFSSDRRLKFSRQRSNVNKSQPPPEQNDNQPTKPLSRTRMRRPEFHRVQLKSGGHRPRGSSKESPVMKSIKRMRIRARDKSTVKPETNEEVFLGTRINQAYSRINRIATRTKTAVPLESTTGTSTTATTTATSSVEIKTERITVSPQAHIIRYTANIDNDIEVTTKKLEEDDSVSHSEKPLAEKLVSSFPMPSDVFR